MKLLGGNKNKMIKDGNDESVPHLEITEVVLVHYNTTNNGYKQDSRLLHTFAHNEWFGWLLDIFENFWFIIFTCWSIVY